MQLVIGAAQFGFDYGITNQVGMVSENEIRSIVNFAKSKHITKFDTAQSYGKSEVMLSQFNNIDIITKIIFPKQLMNQQPKRLCQRLIENSTSIFGKPIYAVLVHDVEVLLGTNGDAVYSSLEDIKLKGFVKKIGVSVYNPDDLFFLLNKYKWDVVQFPMNLLDQRFSIHEVINVLKQQDIETHIRSIFLQGSLLAEETPPILKKWDKQFKKIRESAVQNNTTVLELSINFIKSVYPNAHAVVGVSRLEEIKEIYQAMHNPEFQYDFSKLQHDDPNLTDPTKW